MEEKSKQLSIAKKILLNSNYGTTSKRNYLSVVIFDKTPTDLNQGFRYDTINPILKLKNLSNDESFLKDVKKNLDVVLLSNNTNNLKDEKYIFFLSTIYTLGQYIKKQNFPKSNFDYEQIKSVEILFEVYQLLLKLNYSPQGYNSIVRENKCRFANEKADIILEDFNFSDVEVDNISNMIRLKFNSKTAFDKTIKLDIQNVYDIIIYNLFQVLAYQVLAYTAPSPYNIIEQPENFRFPELKNIYILKEEMINGKN